MSKKDRLKAQSQKQIQLKKQLERQEEEEKIFSGQSRSAKKMRKQAKKFDSAATLILKILMVLPYGWSGFFYGGIFIIGIVTGEMTGMPRRMAAFLGAGSALCLAGIFFAFFSKYIVQFVLIAAGTTSYMHAAGYIISQTQAKLEVSYVTDAKVQVLDKTYMTYFYPILAVTFISAILLIIYLVRWTIKRKRIRREQDNAPVKSIID